MYVRAHVQQYYAVWININIYTHKRKNRNKTFNIHKLHVCYGDTVTTARNM